MKLTQSQIASAPECPEIFLRHYGRLFSITAIATTVDEANAHMREHSDQALLRELEKIVQAIGLTITPVYAGAKRKKRVGWEVEGSTGAGK